MAVVPDNPSNRSVAAALLRDSGVVAYPTDTVYGLGAAVYDRQAVLTLFALKGRDRSQGVPVLIAAESQLAEVAAELPDAAHALAERFWPGALTLIVHRNPRLPSLVTGGAEGVAVRLPDHPCPRALVSALGAPITGTSANRHGGTEPTSAGEVQRQLGESLRLVLDGGPSAGGVPSTIVDVTAPTPRLVRAGAIGLEELRAVCGVVEPTLSSNPRPA